MNIRSLSNPPPVMGKEKLESSQTIKSDNTEDREANGQQLSGGTQDEYRPLTEEELEQIVEKVKNNEAIVKSGLVVKLVAENDQRLLFIESPDGQVLRRFVERDLFQFLQQPTDEPIQLVKKTA